METWRGFWRLSGFERGVALDAVGALLATWAGLRVGGFRRWKAVLVWLAPRTAGGTDAVQPGTLDFARAIARLEQSAARHVFFRPNCLEQSLVLWWLLRRRGVVAELRIGARKEAERFEAHAWVESGGVVLSDANDQHLHFVPFDGPIDSMEAQAP